MLKTDSRSQGNLGVPHLTVSIKRIKEYNIFFHRRKIKMNVCVYILFNLIYLNIKLYIQWNCLPALLLNQKPRNNC